jgi:two-component system NtrC family sensor kinase
MEQGLERIASVVRSVATFSRPRDLNAVPVDVQQMLTASIRLVSNQLRHRAQLEVASSAVPPVLGNPSELGQVFLNVLVNAIHALPERAAAENTIKVSTASTDGRVVVEISDTGVGVPPELIARIFDPFFTTKPIGQGMGLGLSLSRAIVEAMGGTISVRSSEGVGSTFRIELPALTNTTLVPAASEPAVERSPTPSQPRRRVLVIDDEQMLCDMLEAMLEDRCDVTTCTSPREALQRIVAGEFFDVILCDLMMPELTGMDLYDEVKSRRREMADRMVFMTGGTFTARASAFLEALEARTLHKPFRPHELFALLETRACARTQDVADHSASGASAPSLPEA